MGKRFFLMLFPLMVLSVAAEAAINAQYNFESGVPGFVKVQGQGTVTSSADKYKDGSHSLKFEWNGPASLVFENFLDMEASFKVNGAGIIIWIYNTVPSDEPLRFTFWNWSGEEICHFDFNIGYVGWRTAWMKYIDMKTPDGGYYGDIKASERLKNVARMTVEMPAACAAAGEKVFWCLEISNALYITSPHSSLHFLKNNHRARMAHKTLAHSSFFPPKAFF